MFAARILTLGLQCDKCILSNHVCTRLSSEAYGTHCQRCKKSKLGCSIFIQKPTTKSVGSARTDLTKATRPRPVPTAPVEDSDVEMLSEVLKKKAEGTIKVKRHAAEVSCL